MKRGVSMSLRLGLVTFLLLLTASVLPLLMLSPPPGELSILPLLVSLLLWPAAASSLVMLFFRRGVAVPLATVEATLRRVSEGSLVERAEVPGGAPEIRNLASEINETLVAGLQVIMLSMRELVEQNQETGERFARSAERSKGASDRIVETINEVSRQIADLDDQIGSATSAAQQIRSTIGSLAEQIQNQSGAVEETSASVEEMTASIENVANIAEERKQATVGLVTITDRGGERVAVTHGIIQELSGGIKEVLDMISVINHVAAQTNMLAMNAAIEAAHAGEHGRGFAVVADEIRSVAESTSANASRISGTLKGFVKRIDEARESGEETRKVFDRINTEVSRFVQAFEEISGATSELAAGSREMLQAISSLRETTQGIRSASTEIETGSAHISGSLTSIRQFSSSTRTKMRESEDGMQTVEQAQSEIIESASENREQLGKLNSELKFFLMDSEGESRSYNATLRRIILDHKRRLVGARMLLEGKVDRAHIPGRLDGAECLLGSVIAGQKGSRGEERIASLTALERDHDELHNLYNQFLDALEAGRNDDARLLVDAIDETWKKLISYRDILSEMMRGGG
ncbi:MAG: methyl-accepting chemotaxis protein [Spirochaetaceae bacterium]